MSWTMSCVSRLQGHVQTPDRRWARLGNVEGLAHNVHEGRHQIRFYALEWSVL